MAEKTGETKFNEALDLTGFGKFNYLMLLLCGGLVMSMVFEGFSLSFLVAASACELGTSSVEQGLMAGMPLFGNIFLSHIWGYMADTRGRRSTLLLSLFLGFVAGVLSAFSPNWKVLACLKLLSSGAVSGTYALGMTMLSECMPESKRNVMIILATSIFMTSNGIMALLAIPVLPLTFSYHISYLNIYLNSWRLLCLIYSVPCALGALGMWYCFESPKYLLSVGKDDEALDVLRKIHAMNNGSGTGEYAVKSVVLDDEMSAQKSTGLWSSIKSQTLPLLKPPLLKSTIILSILFVGIFTCVNPYMIWLPTVADGFMRSVERGETGLTFCEMIQPSVTTYATNATIATDLQSDSCVLNQTAMLVMLGVCVFFSVLTAAMGSVITCFGRRRILIGLQFLSGLIGLCINFSHNSALSAVMFVLYLSPCLNMGPITTFTVDVYPTHLRAMAVCLTLMVGRGSAIIGINVLKDMLVNNCEASFYLFSSICLVCAFVSFLLPADEKKPKQLKAED